MKKILFFISSIGLTFSLFGQLESAADKDFNQSGAIQLNFIESIKEAKLLAKIDIENDIPFLLLHSGIGVVVYTTDDAFEKKYQVYYHDFGCLGSFEEMMIAYNETIFEYLDLTYGSRWRRLIRKDVVGFKKWRKRN